MESSRDTFGTAETDHRSTEELDQLERSNKKVKNNDGVGISQPLRGSFEVFVGQRDSSHAKASYRDVCLSSSAWQGGNPEEVREMEELEELEEDLSDDDDVVGPRDNPRIAFSAAEKAEFRAPWKYSLIVKLLGRRLGYVFLYRRLSQLWSLQGRLHLIDLGSDFFMVKVDNREDYERILNGGPWIVAGHYLTVRKWQADFDPEEAGIDRVAVWIRLPNLPVEYYNLKALWRIGNRVGRTLKVDKTTEEVTRGNFARVCVEIDLGLPLVTRYTLGKKVRRIEYEGIQLVCFECGRYGHKTGECRAMHEGEGDMGGQQAATEKQPQCAAAYGPWIFAKKPVRRGPTSRGRMTKGDPAGGMEGQRKESGTGSRFALLAVEGAGEVLGDREEEAGVPRCAPENWLKQNKGKEPWRGQIVGDGLTHTQINGPRRVGTQDAGSLQGTRRPSHGEEQGENRDRLMGDIDESRQVAQDLRQSASTGRNSPRIPLVGSPNNTNHVQPMCLEPACARQVTPAAWVIHKQGPDQIHHNPGPDSVDEGGRLVDEDRGLELQPKPPYMDSGLEDQPSNPLEVDLVSQIPDTPMVVVDAAPADLMEIAHQSADVGFQRTLRHHIQDHKPAIVVLVEPRLSGERADTACRQFGFSNFFREEADGFRGGIWVFWNALEVQISILERQDQFIHMTVQGAHQRVWLFTAIYAQPYGDKKRRLWSELKRISTGINLPWLLAGDFNAISSPTEKAGGRDPRCANWMPFARWIDDLALIDLGFIGSRFTWARGLTRHTRVYCRLDRALVNEQWRLLWNEAVVRHLPRVKSDHSPLVICLHGTNVSSQALRPFRFQGAWLLHNDFARLVREHWDNDADSPTALRELIPIFKSWNVQVFGNIFYRKKRLLARINGCQRALERGFSMGLAALEWRLQQELEEVLEQEEILWYQKSRARWIADGDRNTRFFHSTTIIKRRRNRIEALRDDQGKWITNDEQLQSLASAYFRWLYTEEGCGQQNYPLRGCFARLRPSDMAKLLQPFDAEEVKQALYGMDPFKAPGLDGFPAGFFQQFWGLVGESVTRFSLGILNGQNGHKLPAHLNQTLLVLIPKCEQPERIMDFRPISLCNVGYKILSKVIVNRLKPVLPRWVAPNQVSFVPGRHITDNIVLLQEALHSMRGLRRQGGFMVLKLDLEKAYDRLRWDFVRETLMELALPSQWISLIMDCVTSVSMRILWNGGTTESFQPGRGLRQGDPLSPYLFVLCMERLGHLIEAEVAQGNWKPLFLSKSGPKLSHLFFADDVVLFGEASVRQVRVINECLALFCSTAGQKVSLTKSKMLVSRNVNRVLARQLSSEAGIQLTDDLGKYLGLPTINGRLSASLFQGLVDKVQKRLAGWQAKQLSFAGRLTLVKAVCSAMPTYAMQTIPLPASVCDRLDKINRSFLWGDSDDRRRMHLLNWRIVCQPKGEGGLGVRHSKHSNQALLAKLNWRYMTEPNTLWVRVLRGKYGSGERTSIAPKKLASPLWRGMVRVQPVVQSHCKWRVGNGKTVRFWTDTWLINEPLSLYALAPLEPWDLHKKVSAFWLQGVGWDWPVLQPLLPVDILRKLAAFIVIPEEANEDILGWGTTSDGLFSVKAMYRIFHPHSRCSNWVSQFNTIWNLGVPEKIKCFLWQVAHGRVLTNYERWRRGISTTSLCPLCHQCEETLIHLLRDCRLPALLWNSVIKPNQRAMFYQLDLRLWLCFNLMERVGNVGLEDWGVAFAIVCWFLWKWRNEVVFEGKHFGAYPHNVIDKLYKECTKDKLMLGSFPKVRSVHLVGWRPPIGEWVKLNTDGAVRSDQGLACAGGVFRDHSGRWLLGFAQNIGICSSFAAELWGVYTGLDIAWSYGFRCIWLEVDSKLAINSLEKGVPQTHPHFNLVRSCRELLRQQWVVHISHVFREGNGVADWLANHAFSLTVGVHTFQDPLPEVVPKLQQDIHGVSWPRLLAS